MTMQKREVRFQAELRKAASGSRTLKGYAAKFNSLSVPIPGNGGAFIEQLAPGCFAACLKTDAEIRALVDHDHTKILARRSNGSLRIKEDAVGLAVEIDVPNTTWGNDLLACVESDLVAGMSFSLICEEDRWDKATIDGQVWPLRTVVQCSTDEVTATSIPAYPDTTLSTRSYFPEGLPESVELRTSAVSRAASNDLGVVGYSPCDLRSEDPFDSLDEANGIFNWADGEDEDRSADGDAPVKNPLRASQGFLFVKGQGQKRADFIGPHHTIVDGKLAHSQIGALKTAMQLASGKLDIPAEHRAAAKAHIDQELSVWMGDSQRSRLRARYENLFS